MNGQIALVESLASNVNCTTISESVMECNDNNIAENFVNEFSGVVFVSFLRLLAIMKM